MREIPRENQTLNRFVIANRRIPRGALVERNEKPNIKKKKKKGKQDFRSLAELRIRRNPFVVFHAPTMDSPQPSISGLTRNSPGRFVIVCNICRKVNQHCFPAQPPRGILREICDGCHSFQFVVIAVKPVGSRISFCSDLPDRTADWLEIEKKKKKKFHADKR